VALSCRCSSPHPSLKERGPTFRPCLPLCGVLRLGQHNQRARQFVGAERVSSGGDHQFAKLLHLAGFEVTCFVPKCLQFGIEVPWFAHDFLHQC